MCSVIKDRQGRIWIATEYGLNKFDDVTKTFTRYYIEVHDSLSDFDKGLYLFDRKKNRFINYKNNPNIPYSLSNNGVGLIYQDNQGSHWIATQEGLNKLDRFKNKFHIIQKCAGEKSGLNCNLVRAIYQN